ncbi:U11/U12 small nuclear ribonucleoprotein 25 kDa protein [Mizuhopecten yessoensis]|uniref:U11/U12 small nuclear ribonucleoprotein 25 kDa protein n=1 Tax=Mizuhopecten yessoensis TaxID=6573 RepID=A0A210Q906_MIZYE|nr:U11/U12 small nuclear ribonucleoprotein 25 kDa protein [Mizuhopecten yessoensis]
MDHQPPGNLTVIILAITPVLVMDPQPQEDPLLSDLPPQVTLEEVNSCVALEYGQAIVVNVRRADDEVMAVVVTQNATVLDLKHAIKRYITLRQMRNGGKLHISWTDPTQQLQTLLAIESGPVKIFTINNLSLFLQLVAGLKVCVQHGEHLVQQE